MSDSYSDPNDPHPILIISSASSCYVGEVTSIEEENKKRHEQGLAPLTDEGERNHFKRNQLLLNQQERTARTQPKIPITYVEKEEEENKNRGVFDLSLPNRDQFSTQRVHLSYFPVFGKYREMEIAYARMEDLDRMGEIVEVGGGRIRPVIHKDYEKNEEGYIDVNELD